MSFKDATPSGALIKEAIDVSVRETVGKISASCNYIIDCDVSDEIRAKIEDIDAECRVLLRNDLLLSTLLDVSVKNGGKDNSAEYCCFFNDVYENCIATTTAICYKVNADFDHSAFAPPCKVAMSSRNCASLMLLPIALAYSHDRDCGVRMETTRRGDRVEIEYRIKGGFPPIADLIEECGKNDYSNGLFFEEPLLAYSLSHVADACGAEIRTEDGVMTLLLPVADTDAAVNSPAEPYIDNRFSLPYVLLAGILKRK